VALLDRNSILFFDHVVDHLFEIVGTKLEVIGKLVALLFDAIDDIFFLKNIVNVISFLQNIINIGCVHEGPKSN
jgi:hypothetical protein